MIVGQKVKPQIKEGHCTIQMGGLDSMDQLGRQERSWRMDSVCGSPQHPCVITSGQHAGQHCFLPAPSTGDAYSSLHLRALLGSFCFSSLLSLLSPDSAREPACLWCLCYRNRAFCFKGAQCICYIYYQQTIHLATGKMVLQWAAQNTYTLLLSLHVLL